MADLIAQGYSGNELFQQFKLQSKKVRLAVEAMAAEADGIAYRIYEENGQIVVVVLSGKQGSSIIFMVDGPCVFVRCPSSVSRNM